MIFYVLSTDAIRCMAWKKLNVLEVDVVARGPDLSNTRINITRIMPCFTYDVVHLNCLDLPALEHASPDDDFELKLSTAMLFVFSILFPQNNLHSDISFHQYLIT